MGQTDKFETLRQWVRESRHMVAFTGAGVSTESGVPDFRSVDGLYSQSFDYPPETIISHSFYLKNPEYFFRFYREKMMPLDVEPNITHKTLAKWEQEGRLSAVVTQNIDGLHQKAGSRRVYELHGSILRNYCTRCGKFYPASFVKNCDGIPRCSCGGIVKPDVVLYEEGLDEKTVEGALEAISTADMLRQRASCAITGEIAWCSSTGIPRPSMTGRTLFSTRAWERSWAHWKTFKHL